MARSTSAHLKHLGVETKMDVLRKVARIISENFGIEVLFRGDQAFTEGRVIVVPSLPETAPDDLIDAIIGLVDHEVGHIRHTNFSVLPRHADEIARDPFIKFMTNAVEDVRQEHKMTLEFRGMGVTLDGKDIYTRKTIDGVFPKADPHTQFAIGCMARSAKLHKPHTAIADFYDKIVCKNKALKELLESCDDEIATWIDLPDTEAAYQAAKRILKRVGLANEKKLKKPGEEEDDAGAGDAGAGQKGQPQKKSAIDSEKDKDKDKKKPPAAKGGEPGEKGDDDDDSEGEGESDGDDDTNEDNESQSGGGKSDSDDGEDGDEDEEKDRDEDKESKGGGGSGGKPNKSEDKAEDENEGGGAGDKGDDKDDGEPEPDKNEDKDESEDAPAGGGKPEADEDKQDAKGGAGGDEGEDEKDEDESEGGADKGDEKDDDADQEDGDDSEGNGDGDKGDSEGGEAPADDVDPTKIEDGPELSEQAKMLAHHIQTGRPPSAAKGLHEHTAAVIMSGSAACATRDRHRPYSTECDGDVVPAGKGTLAAYSADLNKVKPSVNSVYAMLTRVLMAKKNSINVYGRHTGQINTGAMASMRVGRTDVFKSKKKGFKLDTYVEIVVDQSGSMSGRGNSGGSKIGLAQQTVIVLAEALERCNVKFGICGFTCSFDDQLGIDKVRRMAEKIHSDPTVQNCHRIEPLVEYVYKRGDDSMTTARPLISLMRDQRMASNADGDSVRRVAKRVMQRPESRKILIVLSDGWPSASQGRNVDYGAAERYMTHVSKEIDATPGLEVIGIGIMDEAVRKYYKNVVVVNKIEELPGAAMGKLKEALLEGMKSI